MDRTRLKEMRANPRFLTGNDVLALLERVQALEAERDRLRNFVVTDDCRCDSYPDKEVCDRCRALGVST